VPNGRRFDSGLRAPFHVFRYPISNAAGGQIGSGGDGPISDSETGRLRWECMGSGGPSEIGPEAAFGLAEPSLTCNAGPNAVSRAVTVQGRP